MVKSGVDFVLVDRCGWGVSDSAGPANGEDRSGLRAGEALLTLRSKEGGQGALLDKRADIWVGDSVRGEKFGAPLRPASEGGSSFESSDPCVNTCEGKSLRGRTSAPGFGGVDGCIAVRDLRRGAGWWWLEVRSGRLPVVGCNVKRIHKRCWGEEMPDRKAL